MDVGLMTQAMEEEEEERTRSLIPSQGGESSSHCTTSLLSSQSSSDLAAAVADAAVVALRQSRQQDDNDAFGHTEVEDLITKEMMSVSLNEREKAYEEMHGVSSETEETPELIEEKLCGLALALEDVEAQEPLTAEEENLSVEEWEQRLQQTPRPKYHNHWKVDLKPYRFVKKKDPGYVADPKFRLMFLRASYFQVQHAALCMVKFFHGKFHFFGIETLTRPLYLTDLPKASRDALQSGAFQLLGKRDSSGRAVFFDRHPTMPPGSINPRSIIPAIMYLLVVAAEDEETQRKGLVIVNYFIGQLTLVKDVDRRDVEQGSGATHWIPIKICCIHQCINDLVLRTLAKLIVLDMGQRRRIRSRSHTGTHSEIQYALLSFGIPVDSLPITYNGEIKFAQHTKWIARRKMKDRELQLHGTFDGIELPSRMDVLFGRGRK